MRVTANRCRPRHGTPVRHDGGPMTTTLAIANQKGGVAKTTTVASIGAALAELGHTRAARRPRPAGLPDVLPRHRPRGPRAVDPPRADQGPRRRRGDHRDRGRRRPAAGHDRAGPGGGRPAHPHRPRARHQDRARGPRRRRHRLRLGAARLPAVARRADGRGADRRRRRADPAPVRDALAPRRRAAARHRPRRTPLHQPRARGVGRAADAVRRPHQPRAHGAGDDLGDLRPRGDRAADPEDDQVRRGARRRPVDPARPAAAARARRPTARWPPTSSPAPEAPRAAGRAAAGRRAVRAATGRSGRATAGSASLATSLAVTVVAVLGGVGALPSAADVRRPAARSRTPSQTDATGSAGAGPDRRRPAPSRRTARRAADAAGPSRESTAADEPRCRPTRAGPPGRVQRGPAAGLAGRRPATRCERTYLVSGSVYDNLDPGTYSVYSRSQQAWGIDDSGTMQYFVRFAHGDNGPPSASTTSRSTRASRCRPSPSSAPRCRTAASARSATDAIALWEFAPLGTTVVVTA